MGQVAHVHAPGAIGQEGELVQTTKGAHLGGRKALDGLHLLEALRTKGGCGGRESEEAEEAGPAKRCTIHECP